MSNFKNAVFTILFLFFISVPLLSALSITLVASSNNWSFTMEHRYVSGASNDEYYEFKGDTKVYIRGHLSYEASDWQAAKNNPINVGVSLYRESFWGDEELGSYKIVSPSRGNNGRASKDFYSYLATADSTSDKYYLVFFKAVDDGWDISGNGELN